MFVIKRTLFVTQFPSFPFSTIFRDSADKVGEVTSCSATQMVEFVNHAKTVYGSTVYNWTTVQITNVGVHIGTETFLYHWEGG